MPASTGPNFGVKYGWNLGEFYKDEMDDNLKRIDAIAHLSVTSILSTPPGSPANGDRYIIGASATGAWAGKENQVAVRIGGAWSYYTPNAGWMAFNFDDERLYVFDGSAWGLPNTAGGRELLTINRTYYVRTDGSNSNDGLANTSGGAFLTIQKAVDVVSQTLDIGNTTVTIQVADGTYTGGVIVSGTRPGSGTLVIQGNAGTPANVIINPASNAFFVDKGARVTINDMKLSSSGSGILLYADAGGEIHFTNLNFGATSNGHMRASDFGAITADGNYAISGAASAHMTVAGGKIRIQTRTVTITGTPAFSLAFALGDVLGSILANLNTYSGSATGTRYVASANSVIYTNGGGASYFPGNAAGSTGTGGLYT